MPIKKNYKKKANGKNDTGRPLIWTLEYILEEIQAMAEFLLTPEGKNVLFFKELCIKRGYPSYLFNKEVKQYENEEAYKSEFSYYKKSISEILEIRIWKLGLSKQGNPALSIFALKNIYGYKDVQDINSNNEMKVVFENGQNTANRATPESVANYSEQEKE